MALHYDHLYAPAYYHRSFTQRILGKFAEALIDIKTARQLGHQVDEDYIRDLEKRVQ